MKKYSANYTNTNHNFCFINLNSNKIKTEYSPAISIVKNILQRGKPTSLSCFLQERLGPLHKNKDFNKTIALIDDQTPNWQNIIRGNKKANHYPAKDFYEKIPELFPKHQYIQQLICPEVLITDITQEESSAFKNQQVDFYLPQAFLVIEIDGSHHEKNYQNDEIRDKYLKNHGIRTYRINVKDFTDDNKNFKQQIKRIEKRLENAIERENQESLISLANYHDQHITKKECINNVFCKATAIIRFQLLILDLLDNQKLSFTQNWQIEILEHDIKDFAELAIDDIFNWFEQILTLQKIPFKKPSYKIKRIQTSEYFSSQKNSIQIDFSLLKRFTDETANNPSIVYVRNDYFDTYVKNYEQDVNKKPKLELKELDYFKVSSSDLINYKIKFSKNSDDKKILERLAWDIFLQHNTNLSQNQAYFREGQFEIIRNILERKDTLGLLPTGTGKSLCYQLACILQPAISLVIPPIKALMQDQVMELRNAYLTRANFTAFEDDPYTKEQKLNEFGQGKYLFMLISPERFQNKAFREKIIAINSKNDFAYAVLDEVHCLSEWGHDFRLSYLSLAKTIRQLTKNITFIGLTATASTKVLKDIQVELNLNEDDIKTPSNFSREELRFLVVDDQHNKDAKLFQILDKLKKQEGILEINNEKTKLGIIFTPKVNTPTGCFALRNRVKDHYDLKNVEYFCGEKPREESISDKKFYEYKHEVLKKFKGNQTSLVVATKAFGMGVNKGNVHFTIHYGIPGSMEALYQEGGRAGRDRSIFNKENPARCYTILSKDTSNEKKLWDEEISIAQFKKTKPNGDLNSNFYFLKENLEPIEDEAKKIEEVLTFIKSKELKKFVLCGNEFNFKSKRNTEAIIYKLKQLGVIKDWTIQEWFKNSGEFEVEINNTDDETIKQGLFETINKYDLNFNEEAIFSDRKEYQVYKYILNLNISNIQKYIRILLEWSYRTFIYTRKQSLKTVYENCSNYADNKVTESEFKKSLESYFKFNTTSHIFQKIMDGEVSLEACFSTIFYYQDKILRKETLISRRDSLSRYLENTNDNVGLNLISGLLRLLLDDFNNADGRNRLNRALKNILIESIDLDSFIFQQIIKIGNFCDVKNKNFLAESIYNVSDKKVDLLKLNKILNDEFSLSEFLLIQNKRLEIINSNFQNSLKSFRRAPYGRSPKTRQNNQRLRAK